MPHQNPAGPCRQRQHKSHGSSVMHACRPAGGNDRENTAPVKMWDDQFACCCQRVRMSYTCTECSEGRRPCYWTSSVTDAQHELVGFNIETRALRSPVMFWRAGVCNANSVAEDSPPSSTARGSPSCAPSAPHASCFPAARGPHS